MNPKKSQKEIDLENGIIHAAIIVDFLAGNAEKEGELFRLTEKKLYRVAFNLCKDRQTAKALNSISWENGMKDMKDGKYKEQNSFEKWMSVIIRNAFYKDKNRSPQFNEMTDPVDMEDLEIDAAILHEALLEFEERELPKLTENKQRLIRMFFWENKTYFKIANELGISEGFVRSEIYKICRYLEAKYYRENE